MRSTLLAFDFLALVLTAGYTEPPAPAPAPAIRLPIAPVPPPNPPGPALRIVADQLYIIDSDAAVIVLASPPGVVSVGEEAGPIKIRGKFVDGNGKTQTRTYKGKQVFSVEAIATGRVELLIVPQGATKAGDVVRVMLDVDDGTKPQPPPGPDPAPDPKPKPPVPVTSFRVILISETANNLTPSQRAVLDGVVVENFLNATCTGGKAGWRRRDKDQGGDADPTMAAMWNATKPKITTVPCVAVGVNDKVDIIPLEATPEAMVTVLKKYAEGK